MNKTAVVLFNLGGPDSLEAIEPFLMNLFSDKDIFKIPVGQKLFAKIISNRRTQKVQKQYELIGGKSPINKWTELQRQMLEKELRNEINSVDVFTAMRYWRPTTDETAKKVHDGNYSRIILLPLYPHFSASTTNSSYKEWIRQYPADTSKHILVNNYYKHDKYIIAINERIDEALLKFPEELRDKIQLVFSAHGTPISMVKKGDPYSHQIRETVELIMQKRNNSHKYYLCFQSKVGPIQWLKPSTDQMIENLAKEGHKNLLIIPISFTSDHIETLFELDIDYRHIAEKVGIVNYIVMKGLNDSPTFISTLKVIVLNIINNNYKVIK
ncbi:ferrochelatase [bacterium BMS3Abin04]|nr:ferrochelatase [bacterium BMS3Abin04]